MDMINADMNLGVGGINPKGVQNPQQEENVKTPEKTESGIPSQQSDKVEINSVLSKKEDTLVKGFAQKDFDGTNQALIGQMKEMIQDPTSHALEAQAGGGKTFLVTLYQ